MVYSVQKPVAGIRVRIEEMNEEDKKDCQASYPVESWNVGKAARILCIP